MTRSTNGKLKVTLTSYVSIFGALKALKDAVYNNENREINMLNSQENYEAILKLCTENDIAIHLMLHV